ncbi:Mth938-like domain-containing protein [Marilutibacter aestuarii]|uniref:Xcc1710-like domain-containing protein n=1 Tax=Marilutibacter aestuarii TaxID=1706195 RepID=A0A508AHN0_9GAMM|nr:Mth938-like domain-containing protein [Lysobacter aestuarii]TQD45192.1 hypothetical protein FKV25_08965 [Lysobacter aestuarii]
MPLNLEQSDHAFTMRGADGALARVNERVLARSFILAPDRLLEDWTATHVGALTPASLDPVLALDPEVVLLGTGATQAFPPPAVMAACLTRGIGLEAMSNDAAARTFNVLASEGRRVVAGFILAG